LVKTLALPKRTPSKNLEKPGEKKKKRGGAVVQGKKRAGQEYHTTGIFGRSRRAACLPSGQKGKKGLAENGGWNPSVRRKKKRRRNIVPSPDIAAVAEGGPSSRWKEEKEILPWRGGEAVKATKRRRRGHVSGDRNLGVVKKGALAQNKASTS